MQDTTELYAVRAGVGADGFPPPPPLALGGAVSVPINAPNVINQVPLLPQVTPPVPRPANAATTNPFASSMSDQWSPAPPPASRGKGGGGVRRGVSWLVVLAVLGGITYGGITYGSDLMALATGEDTIDEPSAEMVFPAPTATPPVVRTVSFTVERTDSVLGPQHQEVTADFDSGVTRVVVDRGDRPDLEILTVFDQAVVRRIDEPTWYRIDRGAVPVGAESGRSRWIRTLDELLPAALRPSITIDRATESNVGSIPARRLLMTLDPAALVQATAAAAPVVATPPADAGAVVSAPVDPAVPAPAPAAAPAPAPMLLPPGVSLQVGTEPVTSLQMEIWVDDAGLVRKSILPAELGGETITVTSVSPDEFRPVFPTEDMVQPLTAAAIFRLGL